MAKNKVLGTIGENNLIKDCPVLMPKENMNMFNQICDAADENGKQWENYPNSYKRKIVESFARAASKALNELSSNTLYNAAHKQNRLLNDPTHIDDTDIDTLMKEYDRKKRFAAYADEVKRKEMAGSDSTEDIRNRFLRAKQSIQADRERQASIKAEWETKYVAEIADYILKSRDYKQTFTRFITDTGLYASYRIKNVIDFEKFSDFILTYKERDYTCFKLLRESARSYLYRNIGKIMDKLEALYGAKYELDNEKICLIFQAVYNGLSPKEQQACYERYMSFCKISPQLKHIFSESESEK